MLPIWEHSTAFKEEATKKWAEFGSTSLYSTGDPVIDYYLGGGYGTSTGYEIVTMWGGTGIGKSTMALAFTEEPLKAGKKVGYILLEDDPADTLNRLKVMVGDVEALYDWQLFFLKEQMDFTLESVLDTIEKSFKLYDIIVLDHIQFVFEGSVMEKGETEFNRQRIFMRKLNKLVKELNKTIILICHINKDSTKGGMDKMIGSSAIPQASTKSIEVGRDKEGTMFLKLWKTRFTRFRPEKLDIVLSNMRPKSKCSLAEYKTTEGK